MSIFQSFSIIVFFNLIVFCSFPFSLVIDLFSFARCSHEATSWHLRRANWVRRQLTGRSFGLAFFRVQHFFVPKTKINISIEAVEAKTKEVTARQRRQEKMLSLDVVFNVYVFCFVKCHLRFVHCALLSGGALPRAHFQAGTEADWTSSNSSLLLSTLLSIAFMNVYNLSFLAFTAFTA